MRQRRMVRRYTDDPVAHDAVERILERARRAPSAGYSQGQRFVVVTDPGLRRQIALEACGEAAYVAQGFDRWVSQAPVLVVVGVRAGDYRERYAEPDKAASRSPDDWDVPFWWVDAGAALMLLLLAAVDEGLAAGFLAADAETLRTILAIPDDVAVVGVVTVGRPAPDRRSGSLNRGRRPATVHWNRWGVTDPHT